MLKPSEHRNDLYRAKQPFLGMYQAHSSRPAGLVPFLAVVFLFGALLWAKRQDPFLRQWPTLQVGEHGSVQCVAVVPKPARQYSVIIYAHDMGDSIMSDGRVLRQMADLGLAVVSFEYNQTNNGIFATQLEALLQYVGRQKWADSKAIAWVGFGLGANRMLDFAVQQPHQQPQLFVDLNGGRNSGAALDPELATNLHCACLRMGDPDGFFQTTDLQQGISFRCVGEYVLSHLEGKGAWRYYRSSGQWRTQASSLWLFWSPVIAGLIGWLAWSRLRPWALSGTSQLQRHELVLCCLAALLGVWAVTESALHWLAPSFSINDSTLSFARKWLVKPKERGGFDFLVGQSIWGDNKLKTLLEHVELAVYNRELVNWRLPDHLFPEYVLSPVITGDSEEQFQWRRPLWEEFYPRIRHEFSLAGAATNVVRHLRERVTVIAMPNFTRDVPTIWLKQVTNDAGFAVVTVAVLRSVGVPARLDANRRAEFWNGEKWESAPPTFICSWSEG